MLLMDEIITNGRDHYVRLLCSEVELQKRSVELVSLFSVEEMTYSIYCLLVNTLQCITNGRDHYMNLLCSEVELQKRSAELVSLV